MRATWANLCPPSQATTVGRTRRGQPTKMKTRHSASTKPLAAGDRRMNNGSPGFAIEGGLWTRVGCRRGAVPLLRHRGLPLAVASGSTDGTWTSRPLPALNRRQRAVWPIPRAELRLSSSDLTGSSTAMLTRAGNQKPDNHRIRCCGAILQRVPLKS